MNQAAERPIGVFDSGIGGMTVAHAIKQRLPLERLVYFGDTSHLPYGDKSEAAIQAYSVKIADVLLRKGCKAIVIACNSASSAAYELLKEYVQKEIAVINVIDPMVAFVLNNYSGKHVGLIGTNRTIQSGIYKQKIEQGNLDVIVHQLATPLLAPMVEAGFFNSQISTEIVAEYLANEALAGIDALILACTHYPLIKKEIANFFDNRLPVIDSAEIVAVALQDYLEGHSLKSKATHGDDHFFVSDFTRSFEASTRIFFGERVTLEEHRLWE